MDLAVDTAQTANTACSTWDSITFTLKDLAEAVLALLYALLPVALYAMRAFLAQVSSKQLVMVKLYTPGKNETGYRILKQLSVSKAKCRCFHDFKEKASSKLGHRIDAFYYWNEADDWVEVDSDSFDEYLVYHAHVAGQALRCEPGDTADPAVSHHSNYM